MTAAQINENLYRPIKSGHGYDHLFQPSTCNTVKLASGNTKIALHEMRKWALKYSHHASIIARELKGHTLEETVNNIQWFLYNHVQYSIDGINQNLKSPACTWSTRQIGTDCKSYSIFASAILQNLGIAHYLRRIKQNINEDAFTHVYVVVPIDQEKKKLNNNAVFYQDYLVVDGTIKDNVELPFIEKNDLYMETSLPIYGMAGFFSWLRRAVSNVSEALTGYVPFAGIIHDFTNADGEFFKIEFGSLFGSVPIYDIGQDFDLTIQDEAMLDKWLNDHFTPFMALKLQDIKNIAQNASDIEKVYKVYNDTHEFMALLQWWIKSANKYTIVGYSENAIEAMKAFLSIQKDVLSEQLNEYIRLSQVSINSQYQNVLTDTVKYDSLKLQLPQAVNLDYNIAVLNTIITDTPSGEIIVESVIPPVTINNTKKSYGKIALWLLIGIAIYKISRKSN